MTQADIARYRLLNQQITAPHFTSPSAIVHWLGAVQAQDYAMAKWAIGLRLPGGTNQAVEAAINTGTLIRTHILRPTWHFVAASDIRWLLALTAPHLKKIVASMNRKLELDEALFLKVFPLLEKALAGGRELTRQELMTLLNQAGIRTDSLRAAHIMIQAELEGLVCNGAKREKQFTYALFDEKIPPATQNFSRAEALAALANRYFTSHGPATLPDFAWWSGLTLTDARLGLAGIKALLSSETIAGQTYWFTHLTEQPGSRPESLHVLPAFDEFMVSYQDRTASLALANARAAITGNGIFKPIVVVNGNVVGTWKPLVKKDKLTLALSLFNLSTELNQELLTLATKKYAAFLEATVAII